MAAANDSQGLKIAVASFVSLSVILAVTSYFMYSNYSTADAKASEQEKKAGEATTKLLEERNNFKEWRENISREFGKFEDVASLREASKKATANYEARLNTLPSEMTKAVTDAQARGNKDAEVAKWKETADSLVKSIIGDPQPTYLSRIDRLVDLAIAEGQLITAMANDNVDLRLSLEGVNQSNDKKVLTAQEEAKRARDEQIAEHGVYEEERKTFLDKIDTFQKLNGDQAAQLASLKETLEKSGLDSEKKVGQLLAQIRVLQDQSQLTNDTLAKANGRITFVDYTNKEVRTNVTTRAGAKPAMRLSVFDKSAHAFSNEPPKAVIELIEVNNTGSRAKIIKQTDPSKPLHSDDQVYSVAIGNRQFALVGKIDMNRDGKDDRADVKRLIEMNGGKVVYDLPPPGKGHESGKISASVDWLITDELPPIYTREREVGDPTPEDKDFFKRRTEIIHEAHSLGIRPMPLFKLSGYLGYTAGQTLPGRVESIDRPTSNLLQNRKGNSAPAPAAKPKEDAAKDAAADTEDEPK